MSSPFCIFYSFPSHSFLHSLVHSLYIKLWYNQLLQALSWCLQNLRALIMCGCGNLKYSFPSAMAESFVHLEFLEISNCKFMEGIIIIQEERKSSTLFPKLNQLKLKGLPKLTRFCDFSGYSIELPSLSRMEIQNCPKMQTFASDSPCADMQAIEEPEKVNTEETIHSFFDEKVIYSSFCFFYSFLHISFLPSLHFVQLCVSFINSN